MTSNKMGSKIKILAKMATKVTYPRLTFKHLTELEILTVRNDNTDLNSRTTSTMCLQHIASGDNKMMLKSYKCIKH